jgi:hypothetical protein
MMYLVGKSPKTLLKHGNRNVGRLVQPRDTGTIPETPRLGFLWAADNDAFSGFDTNRYLKMLDKCEGVPGCLFVTVPDVVGDHAATLERFDVWRPVLYHYDLPAAFVAQNGCDLTLVPWDDITTVFIGGDTEWKLGDDARWIVDEGKRRGKWVHMGRVNSHRRIKYANAIGCDSVDGSSLSKFTDTYLPQFADSAAAPAQGILT